MFICLGEIFFFGVLVCSNMLFYFDWLMIVFLKIMQK